MSHGRDLLITEVLTEQELNQSVRH